MAEETKKQVYDIHDLMEMFSCGKNSALRLKKEIKAVSDITHNNRIVHHIDYALWCEAARQRGETYNGENGKDTSR